MTIQFTTASLFIAAVATAQAADAPRITIESSVSHLQFRLEDLHANDRHDPWIRVEAVKPLVTRGGITSRHPDNQRPLPAQSSDPMDDLRRSVTHGAGAAASITWNTDDGLLPLDSFATAVTLVDEQDDRGFRETVNATVGDPTAWLFGFTMSPHTVLHVTGRYALDRAVVPTVSSPQGQRRWLVGQGRIDLGFKGIDPIGHLFRPVNGQSSFGKRNQTLDGDFAFRLVNRGAGDMDGGLHAYAYAAGYVSAAPEPASVALMALGLASVAGIARARRRAGGAS